MNLIKKRPNIESSSIILVILVIVFAGAFFYLDSSSTGFAFLEPEIIAQPEITAEKQDFSINEDVNFTFEFLSEEDSRNINKVEELIQGRAEINKPVKWIKKIRLNETIGNLTVNLPKNIYNLKVSKIVDEFKEEIREDKLIVKEAREVELIIEEVVKEVEAEYETEAPRTTENEIDANRKKITVYSEVHYTNILAYTIIREASKDLIKLYRTTNGVREPTEITNYIDTNNNSLIDKIEWIVPSLSNETYEAIIEISKAEHLDENKQFISNIYEQVRELDGNWSEIIKDREYVRVTFEKNLTPDRDITVYLRIISGNPKIEVYEVDGNEIIATFDSLTSNGYNKVYLNQLGWQGNQNTFDLKVLDGSVEIEHIVDPLSVYDYNSGQGTIHFIYNNSAETNFPPVWGTDGISGKEIVSYTNVQSNNGAYIKQDGGAVANSEPSFRFNFTIAETPASINYIYVYINGFINYDGGEDGDCFVANFTPQSWGKICDMPTSDNDCVYNITKTPANYINGDQFVLLCEGLNLDTADSVNIDYINVTVGYTPATAPSFSSAINDTNITQYQNITMNLTITDNTDLSNYTFSWNNSGSFVNDTSVQLAGTQTTWDVNISKNISIRGGEVIGWRYYACDNSNNCNVSATENYTVPADHYWNNSNLSMGTKTYNTGNVSSIIYANFSWNNVQSATLTCSEGNCSVIKANVSTFTVGAWYAYPVNFSCDSDLGIGYAETNYTLTTNFSSKQRQLAVNCTITAVVPDSDAPSFSGSINNTLFKRYLNASMNITINDTTDIANFTFSWNESGSFVNDTSVQLAGTQTTWDVNISKNITNALYNQRVQWRVYSCDSSNNCNTSAAENMTIANTVPPIPTNLAPEDNTTTTNRTPLFVWNNQTEVDNQKVTWNLYYDDNSGFSSASSILSLTTNNSFPADQLDTDTAYYWRVSAYDGVEYSSNSSIFNVTIESSIVVSVVNASVRFTNLTIDNIEDTTDQNPDPFVIQNDGNVFIDVNLTANKSLWDSVALNTQYFQAKADNNTAEQGAFNFSNSSFNWFNIPASNYTLISQLGFNNTNDSAIVNIRIQVPPNEGPGSKYAGIIFVAYKTV